MGDGRRTVRVAAVQMECAAGAVAANLARAAALVEQAAGQGARLVLLPELVPGGYRLTEEIWDSAEPAGRGPSLVWLRGLAGRLGIHLGMSLLEAEGEDFFNAFYLAAPDGSLAGRVRKRPPASIEAYFYRAGDDPHVIETPWGRLGVGICYENLLACRQAELFAAGVDLVLQPTSAARPMAAFPLRPRDVQAFDRMLAEGTRDYALALGVPVVMANKSGRLLTPLPGGLPAQDTRFPGLSAIVDGDGQVKASLAAEEGVIVADVTLDAARKSTQAPRARGRWCLKVPWFAFLWPLTQWLGERSYAGNDRRKSRARAVSRTP